MTSEGSSSRFPATAVAVAIAIAVAVLPGCGRFARSDSAAPTTTTEASDTQVGSGITVPPTAATPATAATSAPPAGQSPPTNAPDAPTDPNCPPPPANAQHTNHAASGFSVAVVVADRTCLPAKGPFFLTLSVRNTSRESRYHDPNQSEYFEITGNGRRWADRSCLPRQEQIDAPPSELGAGREAIFDARYPLPERSDRNPAACTLPPGRYQVTGILEWCPPASLADGFCSPAESQPIRTPPVAIRLT